MKSRARVIVVAVGMVLAAATVANAQQDTGENVCRSLDFLTWATPKDSYQATLTEPVNPANGETMGLRIQNCNWVQQRRIQLTEGGNISDEIIIFNNGNNAYVIFRSDNESFVLPSVPTCAGTIPAPPVLTAEQFALETYTPLAALRRAPNPNSKADVNVRLTIESDGDPSTLPAGVSDIFRIDIVSNVPTASTWGLVALTALLLSVAIALIIRRRRAIA